MPSPFPGMDPYMEGREWPSTHTVLSVEIARRLAPQIYPNHFVRATKGQNSQALVVIKKLKTHEPEMVIMVSSTPKNRRSIPTEYLSRFSPDLPLIIIDLIRSGDRHLTDPNLPAADYLVTRGTIDDRVVTRAWPISIRERLPVIKIPLEEARASVDLQQAFDDMYDSFGYDLELDYSKPPTVPLSAEDAIWAATRVSNCRKRNLFC